MSSVQTGQLISLLTNNVLMVIIVTIVAAVAWLRWRWLRAASHSTRSLRRRCDWAYISFVLAVLTLLGMLTSLGMLTLRAMVAINALVIGAMVIFLLSVITLLLALGLWLGDLCRGLPVVLTIRQPQSATRPPYESDLLSVAPVALLPAAMVASPRRRRAHRKQRR